MGVYSLKATWQFDYNVFRPSEILNWIVLSLRCNASLKVKNCSQLPPAANPILNFLARSLSVDLMLNLLGPF